MLAGSALLPKVLAMSFSILPPPITPLAAILPSEPLLLMGAGPVPIPQAVAQANGVIINHLGPTMDRVIQNVKYMAAYAFQTRSDKILGIAGPGLRGDGDGRRRTCAGPVARCFA